MGRTVPARRDFETKLNLQGISGVDAMKPAFEAASVTLIAEDGEGEGVQLREQSGRVDDHVETVGPATDAIAMTDRDIGADQKTKALSFALAPERSECYESFVEPEVFMF